MGHFISTFNNETELRDDMLAWFKGQDDIIMQRHEDKFTSGIADISFTSRLATGWIELKHCKKYLADDVRSVSFKRFTKLQRKYLIERGRLGTPCYCLLSVAGDVWLISWRDLEGYRGDSFKFVISDRCHRIYTWESLRVILRSMISV